jgi:hypothetical protein
VKDCSFVYNVHTDDYWVCDATDALMRIFRINPDTGATTLHFSSTTQAHCMSAGGSNRPESRFHYHPELRGFSWAPQWLSALYFFPTA